MKTKLLLMISLLGLGACHKEQRLADDISGTWSINELQWANGKPVAINDDVHKIEFFSCSNAYTATCRGVYFLDYADTLKVDLKDTFQFDIKNDELAITAVSTTISSNQYVVRFLRQRFTIEKHSGSDLLITRIPTLKDSTQGFLKATKL